jgi:hypothetical protein
MTVEMLKSQGVFPPRKKKSRKEEDVVFPNAVLFAFVILHERLW